MRDRVNSVWSRRRGTASVELIASVPVILVALAVAAQIGLAGYALWSAGLAARAGARADLIGDDVDGAVRRALPSVLRDGVRVRTGESVRVGVVVPHLLPLLPDTLVYGNGSLGGG